MITPEGKGPKKVADVSKKVNVELEVDTSVKDLGPNPYAKLIHLARAVDSWRIFPRIFITTYIYLLYKVVIWYMAIPTPTMEQSGLFSSLSPACETCILSVIASIHSSCP